VTPLSLKDYDLHSTTRNEAIVKAYQSSGYTMKEIGSYFKIHYSVVSRIIAVNKKKIMQNERPDPHDPE
jgi:DNA-binding CsgD family transcriptional regulator